MDISEKTIRDLIKKESLRIIKESQASFLKESSDTKRVIEDIDESIIDVNEKRMEKLKSEEKSAIDKEDFLELKRIKEDQVFAIEKLIRGYSKKVELLDKIRTEIQSEMINIQKSGSGFFKNQEISEFSNESFQKDWGLKIQTPNYFINLIKILDNNAYKVMSTNIEGLITNDLLMLPDLKIGGDGNIKVYREVNGRHENISSFKISNINKLIKNPNK